GRSQHPGHVALAHLRRHAGGGGHGIERRRMNEVGDRMHHVDNAGAVPSHDAAHQSVTAVLYLICTIMVHQGHANAPMESALARADGSHSPFGMGAATLADISPLARPCPT